MMVIFHVTNPAITPARASVAISAGSIHNVQMTRRFSMEGIAGFQEKAKRIRGGYKPPDQQ